MTTITFNRVSVNNALFDLITSVLADLKTVLSSKLDGNAAITTVFETIDEVQASAEKQFYTKPKKVKKSDLPNYVKKEPTPYNVFVREKMEELKEEKLDKKDKMKRIGELWRESKAAAAAKAGGVLPAPVVAAPSAPVKAVAAAPAAAVPATPIAKAKTAKVAKVAAA